MKWLLIVAYVQSNWFGFTTGVSVSTGPEFNTQQECDAYVEMYNGRWKDEGRKWAIAVCDKIHLAPAKFYFPTG